MHFDGIKLVVFDLDGTLVDAFEDITAAANHIRELNELSPLPVDEVKRYVGHGARVLVQRVLGTEDPLTIERNHDSLVTYYTSHSSSSSRLYPGVGEVLTELRANGVKTAVATNKPDSVTQRLLEHLGIRSMLDAALGEAEGVPRKPAADMLERLMSELGVKAEHTLMVGDTEVDIKFARAAGTRVVAVTYGQYDREYLQAHGPDAIIDDLPQMRDLLAGG